MFPSILRENKKKNDAPLQDDIRTAIRNATGPRAKLFIPEVVQIGSTVVRMDGIPLWFNGWLMVLFYGD